MKLKEIDEKIAELQKLRKKTIQNQEAQRRFQAKKRGIKMTKRDIINKYVAMHLNAKSLLTAKNFCKINDEIYHKFQVDAEASGYVNGCADQLWFKICHDLAAKDELAR